MKDFIRTWLLLFIGWLGGMGATYWIHECPTEPPPTPAQAKIPTPPERNGIEYGSEDWRILLAIRKAEGNVPGKEFGIMNPEANTLDKQAGWCAASIVKGRQRWIDAGKPEDFITHFGRRYCPPDAHPLNKNWVKNVKYWKDKL
jgi:hypothetical protein